MKTPQQLHNDFLMHLIDTVSGWYKEDEPKNFGGYLGTNTRQELIDEATKSFGYHLPAAGKWTPLDELRPFNTDAEVYALIRKKRGKRVCGYYDADTGGFYDEEDRFLGSSQDFEFGMPLPELPIKD